ncbi:MAG: DUF1232 domain-containing protein [Deferrisomatales bacterium]|nr:DUF1232 domain-containing protein [Deferrisomatales bacterium]
MGEDHAQHYDERSFWEKLANLPVSAGCDVARKALTLWSVLAADSTPLWAKALITGALGYLILPLDFYPDLLPGGFSDDLVVMALALSEVELYVTREIEAEVESRLPARCRSRLRLPPP